MSTEISSAEPDAAEPKKPRFQLPSAYTILFALIVLTALATWVIPAGTYALDADGSPIPGTYEEVDASPAKIVQSTRSRPRSTASTASRTLPPATSTSSTAASSSVPSTSPCSSS